MFTGSIASDDGKSDPSPDKTPNPKSAKKRKRKNGDDSDSLGATLGGGGQAKPARKTSDSNRTINDYFGKPCSSPGRAHSGSKSPSPSSNHFPPCSPQPQFLPNMVDFRQMQPPPGPRPVPQGIVIITIATIHYFEASLSRTLKMPKIFNMLCKVF